MGREGPMDRDAMLRYLNDRPGAVEDNPRRDRDSLGTG
jgi:hypothetical protein